MFLYICDANIDKDTKTLKHDIMIELFYISQRIRWSVTKQMTDDIL